jgi:DNA-binding NtrC family response regulator
VLPPLRNRREDIVPLASLFLRRYCDKYNKKKTLSPNTLTYMTRYNWPGNVRELKNFVERAVVMSFDETIEISNIGDITAEFAPDYALGWQDEPEESEAVNEEYDMLLEKKTSLREYLARCEKNYVEYALHKYGNTYKAAEVLQTSQSSIVRRKGKYRIRY